MDSPDFELIGLRLNAAWLANWIKDPSQYRTNAHMPRLFSSEDKDASSAIAGYLATLQNEAVTIPGVADAAKGAERFKALNCASCHNDQNNPLSNVAAKFRPGALALYLQNPQAHYRWNAMPNFKLSAPEANDIAAFLAGEISAPVQTQDPSFAARGQRLVQTSGCLNCHSSALPNLFSAPSLSVISKRVGQGCLSPGEPNRAPRFNFRTGEREALQSFLESGDFSALAKTVPHEFSLRQIERLQCANCHEPLEGVPLISLLGAKLKPEWSAQFIAGTVAYKPRPWMHSRMPAFPAYAKTLAIGLAALHGVPPKTPDEPPVDPQLAATGAKLISAAGGFSCVACHAVGGFSGGQVVESPGVNLAFSGERMLKSFFLRWVINPVAVDPSTKMPVYFDAAGRSQLIEFFNGDGAKQLDAIWEYLRLGEKMPPPPIP